MPARPGRPQPPTFNDTIVVAHRSQAQRDDGIGGLSRGRLSVAWAKLRCKSQEPRHEEPVGILAKGHGEVWGRHRRAQHASGRGASRSSRPQYDCKGVMAMKGRRQPRHSHRPHLIMRPMQRWRLLRTVVYRSHQTICEPMAPREVSRGSGARLPRSSRQEPSMTPHLWRATACFVRTS